MAKVTNTFVSTDAVGNREELSDVVDRVQRDKTPFYSMISKESATSTYPEWETDEIAAPAANAQPEGNEYTFDAIQPATRVGNYTQIFNKKWIVSNTQNATDNAGDAEKGLKKQKLKCLIQRKLRDATQKIDQTESIASAIGNRKIPLNLITNQQMPK